MKIFLLRHGETNWNSEGRLQGHQDIPMNEKGIQQVQKAGELLLHKKEKIDKIISSPLLRAKQSAKIVASQLGYPKEDIIIEPGFIERDFGLGEGLTLEERKQKFPLEYVYPNMESLENLCKRAEAAITKCVKEYYGQNLLIVSHGAILRAVLTAVTKGEIAYDGGDVVNNGEFYFLEYQEGNFRLIKIEKNEM